MGAAPAWRLVEHNVGPSVTFGGKEWAEGPEDLTQLGAEQTLDA
ncbi:hypothetical protein [Timonella sp. A28]